MIDELPVMGRHDIAHIGQPQVNYQLIITPARHGRNTATGVVSILHERSIRTSWRRQPPRYAAYFFLDTRTILTLKGPFGRVLRGYLKSKLSLLISVFLYILL